MAEFLPQGVRLTGYGGSIENLTSEALQKFIDAVESGSITVPIDKVFKMEQIAEAHQYMDDGHASGKLVVETGM